MFKLDLNYFNVLNKINVIQQNFKNKVFYSINTLQIFKKFGHVFIKY